MTKELQSLIDGYSDLLLMAVELADKTVLTDALVSIDDTQTLIEKELLR
jgi:hypothetical protein